MGPAETTGIVVITVAVVQALISLTKYLVDKLSGKQKDSLINEFSRIKKCGLNEKQSSQLHAIYELIIQKDAEGMPLVYFPRQSMGETQKEIAARLESVAEMQLKMLGIIERINEDLIRRVS